MSLEHLLLIGAVVTLVAIAGARLSSRAGLPALLLFLGVGMLLGDAGLGIHFSNAELAHQLGFAALVVILAEGGLTTTWDEFKPSLGVASVLATVGVVISVVLVTLFAHFVLQMPYTLALLLGGITASTDAAAVFSVLRTVGVSGKVRGILEAESGLNDAPTVLIVTAATASAIGDPLPGGIAVNALLVLAELIGGQVFGAAIGWVASWVMQRITLPSSGLYAIAAMAWAVLSYGAASMVHVSGFAAVYVCGVVMGNRNLPHRQSVRSFTEGLGWIAQIGLFIMLGLLASPHRITLPVIGAGLAMGLFLSLVARPLSVAISMAGFRAPWQEQVFVSWAGLRGAVPIILCTVPLAANVPHSDTLFDVVLVAVIIFTCIQGPTLRPLAKLLGLIDPNASTDVDIEVAPLDQLRADLLYIRIPSGSRLAGVTVEELRLPGASVVSLVVRNGKGFTPSGRTQLRIEDELLVVAPAALRRKVETRFTEIGRGGRLAHWLGVRAD